MAKYISHYLRENKKILVKNNHAIVNALREKNFGEYAFPLKLLLDKRSPIFENLVIFFRYDLKALFLIFPIDFK